MNRVEVTWHIDIKESTGEAAVIVSPITHEDGPDEPCPLKRYAIETEKEIKCTLCVDSFENLESFGSHIFNCFLKSQQPPAPRPPPLEGPFPLAEDSPSRKLSTESTDSQDFIQCADCGAKYRSEQMYLRHFDHFKTCKIPAHLVQRAKEIRTEDEKVLSDNAKNFFVPDPFQCKACEKTFKSEGGLTLHQRYHCKVEKVSNYRGPVREPGTEPDPDPDFVTLWNDDTITQYTGFRRKSFRSDNFPDRLDGSPEMYVPETNVPEKNVPKMNEPDEQNFVQCRLCETNCSNQSALAVHMDHYCPLRDVEKDSAHHNHEMFKFKCDLCLQPFVNKPSLTTHRRYRCRIELDPSWTFAKANPNQFKCDKCDRVFARRNALTRHERYHCAIAQSSQRPSSASRTKKSDANENGSNNDSSDDCPDLSPNSSQEDGENASGGTEDDEDVIDLNALEANSGENSEEIRPEERIIFESAFHIETDSESEDEAEDPTETAEKVEDGDSRPSSGYGTESSSHGKASPSKNSDDDIFHISNDAFSLPEDSSSPSSPKRPILDDILDEIADHYEAKPDESPDDQSAAKKPRLSSAATYDNSENDPSIPKNRVCAFCGFVGKTPAQIRRHEAQVHLNPNKYQQHKTHKVSQKDSSQNQAHPKERVHLFIFTSRPSDHTLAQF